MNTRRAWLAVSACALAAALWGCAGAGGSKNTSTGSTGGGASTDTGTSSTTTSSTTSSTGGEVVTTPSGLQYEDLVVGTGAVAAPGTTAVVHYTGWLTDGTEFDSSKKSGTPLEFQVGAGRMIAGFDEAVSTMKVGGKRKITLPPALGYGAAGRPPAIPPNSTLVFELELVAVK